MCQVDTAVNCMRSRCDGVSHRHHLPVAYHGRTSSIVVSGLPVQRPRGQVLPPGSSRPELRASRVLDFELEVVRRFGCGRVG